MIFRPYLFEMLTNRLTTQKKANVMMQDSHRNQTSRSGAGLPRGPKVARGLLGALSPERLKHKILSLLLGGLALGLAHSAEAQTFTQRITYTPTGTSFYDTIEAFIVGDPADAFAKPGFSNFDDATPSNWSSGRRDRRQIITTGIAPGATTPAPLSFDLNFEGAMAPVVVDLVVWDGGSKKGTIVDAFRLSLDGAGAYDSVPIPEARVSWCGVPSVFVKRGNIMIPASGAANSYPVQVRVKNTPTKINKITVDIKSLTHTRPSDLQFLLVGPTGLKALIMADTGGTQPCNGVALTFDDAATQSLPSTGPLVSGTYKPTLVGQRSKLPSPAPAGPYTSPLSVFNGTVADGIWSLYVFDDLAGSSGNFKGGWSLTVQ